MSDWLCRAIVVTLKMGKYRKLTHTIYYCVYHIVWTPKYRYRVLKGILQEEVEKEIRTVSDWIGCEIKELNVREDHVHVVVLIPPKVSVSAYVGTVKGKTAIRIFQKYPIMKPKLYWGNHFWARGYFVNTVGVDEDLVRRYVKYQEAEEKREEKQTKNFNLF